MLGTGRRLLAVNALFEHQFGTGCHDTPSGLRLTDAMADAKLGNTLEALRSKQGSGASLPISLATTRAVLHVLPIRGAGRDIFFNATAFLILAAPRRATLSADLIQCLLDLTPAEARLAQALASVSRCRKPRAATESSRQRREPISSGYSQKPACRAKPT